MNHRTFEFKLVKCFSTVFDKKKKRSLTVLNKWIIYLDLFQWQEMHVKSFRDVFIFGKVNAREISHNRAVAKIITCGIPIFSICKNFVKVWKVFCTLFHVYF